MNNYFFILSQVMITKYLYKKKIAKLFDELKLCRSCFIEMNYLLIQESLI